MKTMLFVILTAAITNNYVLVKFLGICPFLGVSKKLDQATGMSLAVIFVEVLATAVTWENSIGWKSGFRRILARRNATVGEGCAAFGSGGMGIIPADGGALRKGGLRPGRDSRFARGSRTANVGSHPPGRLGPSDPTFGCPPVRVPSAPGSHPQADSMQFLWNWWKLWRQ